MILTPMCHQTVVGIMTLLPQSLHFCCTSFRIISDCSGKVPHGALEEAHQVPVVADQGDTDFAHRGRPDFMVGPIKGTCKTQEH